MDWHFARPEFFLPCSSKLLGAGHIGRTITPEKNFPYPLPRPKTKAKAQLLEEPSILQSICVGKLSVANSGFGTYNLTHDQEKLDFLETW